MKFKSLLLAVLMVSAQNVRAAGEGAEGGGGGGGLCFQNGSCITLTEAGLRIQDTGSFEVEREVVDELDQLKTEIPVWFNYTAESVVGNFGVIRPVSITSEKRFKNIVDKYTEEYRLALQAQGGSLPPNFELIAFSHNSVTYLILDRYNRLPSVRSKALLLLHELNMRKNANLIDALRFDGVLLDYLEAKKAGRPFDIIKLHSAHMKLFSANNEDRFAIIIELLRATGKTLMTDIEVFGKELNYNGDGVDIDYYQILHARKFRPTIAQELEPGPVIDYYQSNRAGRTFRHSPGIFDQIWERHQRFIKQNMRKTFPREYFLTPRSFAEFLKAHFWPEQIEAFNFCMNTDHDSAVLILTNENKLDLSKSLYTTRCDQNHPLGTKGYFNMFAGTSDKAIWACGITDLKTGAYKCREL